MLAERTWPIHEKTNKRSVSVVLTASNSPRASTFWQLLFVNLHKSASVKPWLTFAKSNKHKPDDRRTCSKWKASSGLHTRIQAVKISKHVSKKSRTSTNTKANSYAKNNAPESQQTLIHRKCSKKGRMIAEKNVVAQAATNETRQLYFASNYNYLCFKLEFK